MNGALLSVELRLEQDVVLARQRARHIACSLGFDSQDQTRVATAVSEMSRNAFKYAGGGRVEFSVRAAEPWTLCIKITDQGPGIAHLEAVLRGDYESTTGMGLGILGSRRLMDVCEIRSAPGAGTQVLLGKYLPKGVGRPTPESLGRVAEELARERPSSVLEEVQQQNQELIRALEELRQEREALAQVNRELEETNRGVVALYAELDERADYLQRANELKTKFLSNMTHEFRTPLNSITSLTRLLLQRMDGGLTAEQEKQVRFIQRSADSLSELVNDLLDLAKVEAGKILVRPSEFTVESLFATLRGMLRPLLAQNSAVELVFTDASGIPPLLTDESKVSQILRNFISNAIKYTERGTVQVSARAESGNTVVFEVTDTGIGIAPEDHEIIFQEYSQLDNPLQSRVRGTGLGLPLSRKLAGLLGGSVGVNSELSRGSSFYAIIPSTFSGPTEVSLLPDVSKVVDPMRSPVLVLEDNRETVFIYEKYLKNTGFQVLAARTLREARDWLRSVRPAVIIMDILLENENAWSFISELRGQDAFSGLPIVVVTMVDNENRALSLGADAFRTKPIERDWLLATLTRLTAEKRTESLLIIDDDEVSRYLLRGLLAETRFGIIEAASAREGLLLAREEKPLAVFLDLVMHGVDGFAVLELLKSDPATRGIPVFIHTSKTLTALDRSRLADAAGILSKAGDSREAQAAAVKAALVDVGLGESRAPSARRDGESEGS
jgi:signal transduction histidine kinase/CheY-like chemotaxis protein